jgi:hypothetical protein
VSKNTSTSSCSFEQLDDVLDAVAGLVEGGFELAVWLLALTRKRSFLITCRPGLDGLA